MTTYHLSLFAEKETTSIDIEAPRDSDAAVAGTVVFQACSDVCDSFELRRNASWIAGMSRIGIRNQLRIEELSARTQELVLQTEETLLHSQTRIAASRRLLERTDHIIRLVRRPDGQHP